MNIDGSDFQTIYSWSATGEMRIPVGGVVKQGSRLFGEVGSTEGWGAVYALSLDASVTNAPANGGSVSEEVRSNAVVLTETPMNGFMFLNWSQDGKPVTAQRTESFADTGTLETITANFMSTGPYDGLFYPSNGVTRETSGMLSHLILSPQRTYSARLLLEGRSYPLHGRFDISGHATNVLARAAAPGGAIVIEMTLDNTNAPPRILGQVSGTNGGGWTAGLAAYVENRASQSSNSTVLIQPTGDADAPPGYGYLVAKNYSGLVTLTGALADGTVLSEGTAINESGAIPLFSAAVGNPDMVLGWLVTSNAGIGGTLTWIREPSAKRYPQGFTNIVSMLGSLWANEAVGVSNLALSISGGDFASNEDYAAGWTQSGALKATATNGQKEPRVTGALNLNTGVFGITFRSGAGYETHSSGVFLQNLGIGGGYFLSRTNAGAVVFSPVDASTPQDPRRIDFGNTPSGRLDGAPNQ